MASRLASGIRYGRSLTIFPGSVLMSWAMAVVRPGASEKTSLFRLSSSRRSCPCLGDSWSLIFTGGRTWGGRLASRTLEGTGRGSCHGLSKFTWYSCWAFLRPVCRTPPHLWNHLPLSVREADTICMFKSRLKTFLFDKAYS